MLVTHIVHLMKFDPESAMTKMDIISIKNKALQGIKGNFLHVLV